MIEYLTTRTIIMVYAAVVLAVILGLVASASQIRTRIAIEKECYALAIAADNALISNTSLNYSFSQPVNITISKKTITLNNITCNTVLEHRELSVKNAKRVVING
ncbi:hypothetical protein DRN75_00140 [Nanoarchaeota archaeon]|nr:MAG: hypothetical protein DRN75_00140 [Nanoarchaeota archaeon]